MRPTLLSAGLALSLLAATPAGAAKRALVVRFPTSSETAEAADHVKQVLLDRGFTVEVSDFDVPPDLGRYCCVWDLRPFNDLSPSDRSRFADLLRLGHGLILLGENAGCCAGRNATIQDFLNNDAGAGGVAIDPLNEILGEIVQDANPHPATRDPNRVDNVVYDGRGAGVFQSVGNGTHLTPRSFQPGAIVAAAFDEGTMSAAPAGRAVVVLDVNWLDDAHFNAWDNHAFTDDISHFLCPVTASGGPFTARITSPASFVLECPATLSIAGTVTGSADEDCAQPTSLTPSRPTLLGGIRITRIDVSVNGGPFLPVSSTTPALPADTPVDFFAAGLGLALGGNTVTVRARAEDAREAFDSISGTLLDTLPPVIDPATCLDQTVDLGPSCQLLYAQVPAASDQCDPLVAITSVPPLPVAFNGPGQAAITYTAADDSGNLAACSRQVTAVDLSPPALTCAAPVTVECKAQGGTPASDAEVQAFLAATTAVDNCSNPPSLSGDAPAFFASGCLPGLATAVTWTASDGSGHSATCTATLTVADRTPPEITATPAPLSHECTVQGGLPADDPDLQAWLLGFDAADLCAPAVVLSSDLPALVPTDCGGTPTTVTFAARDDCDKQASFAQTVHVTDTVPPALTPPPPLDLECNAPGGVPAGDPVLATWMATATDLCSQPTVERTLPPLLPSGCGAGLTTDVPFLARDGCGNQTPGSAPVTVHDRTGPALNEPGPLALECSVPGGVPRDDPQVQAWLASATATDVCDGATIGNDAPALLPAGCGGAATSVTFVATDNCNNQAARTATVTVDDTTAPTLTVPAPLTLECSGPGGVPRDDPQVQAWLAAAAAADICGAATVSHDAPALLAAGCGPGAVTTVTFTAGDACGNLTVRTSTITVTDLTAPDLSVPAPLVLECTSPGGVPAGDPQVQAWLAAAAAADLCAGATLTHDAPAFFPSACGAGQTTTVTFLATDDCGNQTTKISTVTVMDTAAPLISLPAPLVLECDGPGGIPAADPRIQAWIATASAGDACGTATLTATPPAFFPSGCAPGTTTAVTFTAVDDCGNVATASGTVTVLDTTPPSLVVPGPLALECNAAGGVPATDPQVVAWLALAIGSDVCDGATVANDAPALFASGCGAGASTTVTFVASDSCGNASAATATVTVTDTTPPALGVPPPLTLECSAPGGVPATDPEVVAWLGQASAADVCDGATLGNDAPALFPSGCAPGKPTMVTFTAADNCANTAKDGATLTVADTTPPEVAGCALEPWDPVIGAPRAPRPPESAVSCASSGTFRVDCGTIADLCDTRPLTPAAEIVVRRHEVVDRACVPIEVVVPVLCRELIELRLEAPPCPARPPKRPRPPLSVTSAGLKVIAGERLRLRVRATDGCGNISRDCEVDPAGTPDPTNPGQPLLCPPKPAKCPVSACGE